MLTILTLRYLVVITHVKAKLSRVDAAMAPEEKSTKHRFRQDIEDTVKNGFGVRRDDVPTFCKSPCNWI